MMKAMKMNDAATRLFDKQNRTNTLLGIVGWASLALGVILFFYGLWTHFHSAGGPLTATYRDSTVYVEAFYGKEAKIPGNAELKASLVTPENDPDAYSQKMAAAMTAMGGDGEAAPTNVIYHVGFYVGDQEVEPAAPVNVVVQVLQDGFSVGQPVKVIHFGENDAEVIADTSVDDAGFISFTTDSFSDFVFIMQTETVEISSWDAIRTEAGKSEDSVYQLTQDITANSICKVTGNLTIDLNGHTITSKSIGSGTAVGEDKGYVMFVEGNLTIMDSSNSKGKFTVGDNDPFGLVYIRTGGTLTLNGGTFENSRGFHAFRVSGGNLIMNGGTIQNSGSATDSGGGGPISVTAGGNLEINGGTIKNNKATTGGAIQFEGSGNFTMTGGEITGNSATNGGLYFSGCSGSISITGGTITGNTAGNNGGGLYFKDCTGIINITGGTISNNTVGPESHGGGIWFGNCSNITIGGTAKITGNKASAGGGIRIEDSTMTIKESAEISDNIAESNNGSEGNNGIGGGIAAYQSKIIIDGGTIKGNKAEFGGGGIALRSGSADYTKNNVELVSGSISDNEVTGGEWNYGGGVYLQDHTSFTMTGGTVSGNHGKGQGGGIATDYSGVKGDCTGDMLVTINGGTIENNYSELHEGGGIGMGSGMLVIEAKPGPVYITGNESRTTEHWGGGGIMISDKSQAVIVNALIENNSAGGFGGGLGACSTGHVYYGVGVDEDNPSPLAAIFGNTAQGENLSGTASKKEADHTAYGNSVFMNSGYQDVYSALEAVISGAMLGGGDEAWTGSADGAPVMVGKDGFASASQMMGLTSNATEEDRDKARAAVSVFITGNHSNTHGGGIMCNGSLAMGWETKMDITPGLKISGTKQYEVKGAKADAVPEFQFAISNKEPTWIPDTEGTGGHWQAVDGSGVFTTKNSLNGSFAFDLTFEQMPGLQKKTGEQTFYFWEVNEGGNGVTYDQTLYKVTVTVSEKTETKQVAGATLYINTWSIDSGSAKVEKRAPGAEDYTSVNMTQSVEKNTNSEEPMHWTTRTVIELTGNAFQNTYNGEAKLSLKKVDEDRNPVKGAEFTLYRKDENGKEIDGWEEKWIENGTYISDEDGIIYADGENPASNLPVGIYRLVETQAPEGYKLLPGYIEFEIAGADAHRMISCPYNPVFSEYVNVTDNGLTLQIQNVLAFKPLKIVKYGADETAEGKHTLAGAVFELYIGDENSEDGRTLLGTLHSAEDGSLVFDPPTDAAKGKCRIGEDGTLQGLMTGKTYYLKETKAPEDYDKLPEVEFKVTGEGVELAEAPGCVELAGAQEGVGSESGDILTLKLTDLEMTVRVALLKFGYPGNIPLAGAVFELYGDDYLDADGKVNEAAKKLWSGTSAVDADGHSAWEGGFDSFPELKVGQYYLVETKAPDGYNLPDSIIQITVASDGTVSAVFMNDGENSLFHVLNPVEDEEQRKTGWLVAEDGTLRYDYVFMVPNSTGYQLPKSGGSGTLFYIVIGLALTLGSGIVLIAQKRRRQAQ